MLARCIDTLYVIHHKVVTVIYGQILIYVIPRSFSIDGRIKAVPTSKCAGLGPEYIIEDLKESEFEIIEP
jgi:hypothetical protein